MREYAIRRWALNNNDKYNTSKNNNIKMLIKCKEGSIIDDNRMIKMIVIIVTMKVVVLMKKSKK